MLDIPHILYILISGALTALGLFISARFAKDEKVRDTILKSAAVVTVIIHYSNLWVDYLTTGTAVMEDNQLLMVYPCNIIMWLLLAYSLTKNKKSAARVMLADFTFWGGVICGVIGIVFNMNYDANPNLLDYDILKGLLSHSTMLFGCIYLLVGGYVKPRVFNVIGCTCGMLFFVLNGTFINWLYDICGLPPVNAMFLQGAPFPGMDWLTPGVICLLAAAVLLILFGALALYEFLTVEKEDRWDTKLKTIMKERGILK